MKCEHGRSSIENMLEPCRLCKDKISKAYLAPYLGWSSVPSNTDANYTITIGRLPRSQHLHLPNATINKVTLRTKLSKLLSPIKSYIKHYSIKRRAKKAFYAAN